MKNLIRKISIFSVLAFITTQGLTLHATENEPNFEQDIKFSKLVEDILQKFKIGQYVSKISLNHIKNNNLEELKQIDLAIMPNHDLFDSWIIILIMTFPKDSGFDRSLKLAKEKGESETATPASQNNLGYMYQHGKGVDQNSKKAVEWYQKAARQKNANTQNNLGYMYQHGEGVDQDFKKAFEWYQKAAEQGFAIAQFNLGYMYFKGQGIDQDLAQSLKWCLKSFKNKDKCLDLEDNLKNIIKELVTFVLPTIILEHEIDLMANQKTLKNNIEAYLVLHEIEKGINRAGSSFKESQHAIPSFFKSYQEIIAFEEIVLKVIKAYDQPGFMVTCLQPKDTDAFKSSKCPDIKYYELPGQSYLTFGKDNIEMADWLMDIILNTGKVLSYNKTISDILSVQNGILASYQIEVEISDLAKALNRQHISRLQLMSDDPSDELTHQVKLIKKIEEHEEVLTQLQEMPQYLKDLLIKGAPYRNKQFLKKEDYIESIFKD